MSGEFDETNGASGGDAVLRTTMPEPILIVGAGISGLNAGLALDKTGMTGRGP